MEINRYYKKVVNCYQSKMVLLNYFIEIIVLQFFDEDSKFCFQAVTKEGKSSQSHHLPPIKLPRISAHPT